MFKLALDAGHWYGEAGRRCLKSLDPKEHREWWLNDRICDRVEKLLAGYNGIEVLRVDDTTGKTEPSLSARCKAANSFGADFYLSVHHNGGVQGGSGGGIVAFALAEGGEGAKWRDAMYDALIKETGLKGNRAQPKSTANFQVLRDTDAPAVLLELGFMDSKTDVPIIITDEYADQCAAAIVSVLAAKGGLTQKKDEDADRPSAWAESAWLKAKEKGVLDGTRPGDPITRQELAVVLDRLGLL